jgi:tRNA threonylcarbamoyladenosine biosynthesis protein TsaB
MNSLQIDTRNSSEVSASLEVDGKKYDEVSKSEHRRPESILNLIDLVCKKANISVHDIDEIHVEEGPGSYTGLKVGATVANTLSVALNKPVNGKPPGEFVEPVYE